MLINPSVTNYLRKYLNLAYRYYDGGDWGLAAFFGITVIEECAKILMLRDANLEDEERKRSILNHSDKHFSAIINLLDGSEEHSELPQTWQKLARSWLSSEKLTQIRNRSLYLWFDTQKNLTTPEENVTANEAAFLVYLAGFASAALADYVDLDSNWVQGVSNEREAFREKHLLPSVHKKHTAPEERREDMVKWEYLIVDLSKTKGTDDKNTEELMNSYGDEGWELVTLIEYSIYETNKHSRKAYFKRQKKL